jgi:hypothetical protein
MYIVSIYLALLGFLVSTDCDIYIFSDLLHIHSNCRTPEKMALTLLDYLFDRETQAISNLSGLGKHGKKQLDPLMIYGIRCKFEHSNL